MSSFQSKSGKAFRLSVPQRQPLFSGRVWLLLIALTAIVAVGVPVCALLLPGHRCIFPPTR